MTRLMMRGIVPLALLFPVLLFTAGRAAAHAFPVTSDPKVGSTVSVSPPVVRIWFDGALEAAFSTITVQDAGGGTVDKGDGRVGGAEATLLQVTLPSLKPGRYKVVWSVAARDGHRTQGDYTFDVK